MTARDRTWRLGGFALMGAGYAVPLGGYFVPGSATYEAVTVLIGMPLAIAGALLLVQGDRVRRILRIERSRHRNLVLTIREIRARRRGPSVRGVSDRR